MHVEAAFAQLEVAGNRLTLLRDGAQAYPAMLEAIRGAQQSICIETYVLRADRTGERFAQALCERARSGVTVRVIFDAWGSEVPDTFLHRLTGAGVTVERYGAFVSATRLLRGRLPWSNRNHRKALVADGRVAFVGGMNLCDDYAAVEDGGKGWRDTHLKLEGPAAGEVQRTFDELWRRLEPGVKGPLVQPPKELVAGVQIVGNDFRPERRYIRKAYRRAIDGAQRRIWLTHAYFLPPRPMVRALRHAAGRGVDVRIIAAGVTDVPMVRLAALGLIGRLLRAGVRVFELQGRVLHAKTAVIDSEWCTVGSANLDALSLVRNLELNAFIVDRGFGHALERMFEEDLRQCRELELQTWRRTPLWLRVLSRLALLFRRWM